MCPVMRNASPPPLEKKTLASRKKAKRRSSGTEGTKPGPSSVAYRRKRLRCESRLCVFDYMGV